MKNKVIALIFSAFFIGIVSVSAQEGPSTSVAGGGVLVKGWTGQIDAKETTAGLTINNAKLAKEGDALRVTTGPAVTYWNATSERRL